METNNNNSAFRVIIAGSRGFSDYDLLRTKCDRILSGISTGRQIVVVSGTARGADQLGERYARERGFAVRQFPADWERHGKQAGYLRNREMAENADALIAFWDGQSHGTKMMIDLAMERGLNVRIITVPAEVSNTVSPEPRRTIGFYFR